MNLFRRIVAADARSTFALVRLLAGVIFLSEDAQELAFPDALGAGRFARIGLPAPESTARLIGISRRSAARCSSSRS